MTFDVPATQEIKASVLTETLIAALPGRVGGLVRDPSVVRVKPIGADFSASEQTTITSLVQAHDGAALKAAWLQRINAGRAELLVNALQTWTLAEIDTRIDAIGSLAEMKVALKHIARCVKALAMTK